MLHIHLFMCLELNKSLWLFEKYFLINSIPIIFNDCQCHSEMLQLFINKQRVTDYNCRKKEIN